MSDSNKHRKEIRDGAIARTKILLGLIVFMAGGVVMAIEISGNRLIAPVFGNSVYTWTALIGVVLVAYSAGSYIGGRLVDRKAAHGLLSLLLVLAGLLTAIIPLVGPSVARWFQGYGLIAGPMAISLVLFLAPGVLLGMVYPFALRLHSLTDGDHSVGGSAGYIGMLGSLGSFAGTFATGFFLLPAIGATALLYTCAVILCLLAVVPFLLVRFQPGDALRPGASAALCLVFWWMAGPASTVAEGGGTVLYSKETFYHRIQVVERPAGDRLIRELHLDSTVEGGMYVDNRELAVTYQGYWRLLQLDPDFQMNRALFIGAGAFGMPEVVSRNWPGASIDVAEIDPEVVEAGRRYFFLDEYPGVKAHAIDGRRFLLTSPEKYDFVFADAYNGVAYIPPHLITKEFFQLVDAHLTDQGVLMMNVISALKGPQAEVTQSVLATLEQVFPHVAMYGVMSGLPGMSQNVIFVAGRAPLDRFAGEEFYLPGAWQKSLVSSKVDVAGLRNPAAVVFTDDKNPVEQIIARQLRLRSKDRL